MRTRWYEQCDGYVKHFERFKLLLWGDLLLFIGVRGWIGMSGWFKRLELEWCILPLVLKPLAGCNRSTMKSMKVLILSKLLIPSWDTDTGLWGLPGSWFPSPADVLNVNPWSFSQTQTPVPVPHGYCIEGPVSVIFEVFKGVRLKRPPLARPLSAKIPFLR